MFSPSIIKLLVSLVVFSCASQAFSKELIIFDVRKNIAMSDDEPVYRDFYLNGGTEHGLREGMVITVRRRSALYDAYKDKNPGDLLAEVGRLKIIYAQNGVSVAREFDIFNRHNRPILEDNFFLIGDRLDPASAVLESKVKKTKKTSKAQPQRKPRLAPKRSESADFASRVELEPLPNNDGVNLPSVQ